MAALWKHCGSTAYWCYLPRTLALFTSIRWLLFLFASKLKRSLGPFVYCIQSLTKSSRSNSLVSSFSNSTSTGTCIVTHDDPNGSVVCKIVFQRRDSATNHGPIGASGSAFGGSSVVCNPLDARKVTVFYEILRVSHSLPIDCEGFYDTFPRHPHQVYYSNLLLSITSVPALQCTDP